MKTKILPIFLAFAIIISSSAGAEAYRKGHMKLLAVSEQQDGYSGLSADLYLEIQPGEGKVFIESFPLTKMDTQISTRFAKEIACTEFQFDCDKYNFFYTIKADTALVGGPSAGAAASVLTVSVIEGIPTRDDVVMTGTINSGGLIGPVGGLKEKITAAKEAGLKKVLIPEGERYYKSGNSTNQSTDLSDYGKNLGIEVIEVSDIKEALYQFTGKKTAESNPDFGIEQSYIETMKNLAFTICNESISSELLIENNTLLTAQASSAQPSKAQSNYADSYSIARNLSKRGQDELKSGHYYSAASYCFGANVRNRYLLLEAQNYTKSELPSQIQQTKTDAETMEKGIPESATITDFQAYAAVKERLIEAYYNLNTSASYNDQNRIHDALFYLAYAQERVMSARAWAQFLGKGSQKLAADKEVLEASCRSKISEAEERYEYSQIYIPESILPSRKDIDRAYDDLKNKDYGLCLSKASKAKAESDVLLSSLGLDDGDISKLVARKLEAAKRTISRNTNKGIFPIVGYSYYEYSTSLNQTDPYSSLLYAEYALELSDMDIYFKEPKSNPATGTNQTIIELWQRLPLQLPTEAKNYAIFSIGLISGAVITLAILKARKRRIVKKASLRRR
ncbi:hypothetical protein HYY72_03330 [Candidatus Woesearchaeota archaeon]|nr:hypothetical protein [Candidatus Woesearchaeota archaeon]